MHSVCSPLIPHPPHVRSGWDHSLVCVAVQLAANEFVDESRAIKFAKPAGAAPCGVRLFDTVRGALRTPKDREQIPWERDEDSVAPTFGRASLP